MRSHKCVKGAFFFFIPNVQRHIPLNHTNAIRHLLMTAKWVFPLTIIAVGTIFCYLLMLKNLVCVDRQYKVGLYKLNSSI